MDYKAPTGAPPEWGNNGGQQHPQQLYQGNGTEGDRGMFGHHQQQQYGGGYPPQQGYYQQPQQGYYQQPQQGYYQQQQPVYVQQQGRSSSDGCLTGCLAALCVCCTLDMLF